MLLSRLYYSNIVKSTSITSAIKSSNNEALNERIARIYKSSKSPTQSGTNYTEHWKVDFSIVDKWENPLMGWTSSADPLQALQLKFDTKEQAIKYVQSQGFKFIVDQENEAKLKGKSYAENFLYSKGKLKNIHTK